MEVFDLHCWNSGQNILFQSRSASMPSLSCSSALLTSRLGRLTGVGRILNFELSSIFIIAYLKLHNFWSISHMGRWHHGHLFDSVFPLLDTNSKYFSTKYRCFTALFFHIRHFTLKQQGNNLSFHTSFRLESSILWRWQLSLANLWLSRQCMVILYFTHIKHLCTKIQYYLVVISSNNFKQTPSHLSCF